MNIYELIEKMTSEHKTIFDMPLRVTFYARVSTHKEEQLNSQENQIEKLVPKGAYEEILNYLNEKTKRNFRNIETNRKHIRARFNESKSSPYTVEDFKKVIDNKCAEWLGDEKMQKYLRPETLFGRKFESYLNNDSKWKGYNCKRTNESEESEPYADQQFGLVL